MKRMSSGVGPTRIAVLAIAAASVLFGAIAAQANAATFTVTSTADAGDANTANPACATVTGACTLRAAIDQANASGGGDVISLPGGTYQLTGAADDDANVSGDLDIDDVGNASTTINGAGARTTSIVSTGADRVIDALDEEQTVSISGISVSGGGGVDEGGGILADATLNLTNASVVNNRADAAISTANEGGGIFINEHANLSNVTISGNVAARGASNSFGPQGGGVFDNGSPTSSFVNVTISGNQATGAGAQGGGVFYNADANSTTYTNVSLVANSVSGSGSEGGGIWINDELTLKNTIVALNRVGASAGNCELNDTLHSAGHNLEEGNDCALSGAGDLQNANPLLGALANNGGPVDTQALLSGSPALDTGDSAGCPATDARGVARPQGPACDIGAFETAVPSAAAPSPTTKAKCKKKKKKHKKHAASAKKHCKKKKKKRR
jgi:CSLREA domain-containing protein